MKYTAAVLVFLPLLAAAQRITGDSACVSACYNLSSAVVQCSDKSDPGVIACICPQSDQVALLGQCHDCIGSLSGTTDLEKNSVNSLYTACQSSSSSATSSATSSTSTGSLGAGAASISSEASSATKSSESATSTSSSSNSGAGQKLTNPLAMVAVGAIAVLGYAAC